MILFFKQRAAIELSVSDWSADVCSSDLGHGHIQILLPKIWPPVPTAVNRPFGTCRWKSADPYAIRCRLDVQVECRVVRANEPLVLALPRGRILNEVMPLIRRGGTEPAPAYHDPHSPLRRRTKDGRGGKGGGSAGRTRGYQDHF